MIEEPSPRVRKSNSGKRYYKKNKRLILELRKLKLKEKKIKLPKGKRKKGKLTEEQYGSFTKKHYYTKLAKLAKRRTENFLVNRIVKMLNCEG